MDRIIIILIASLIMNASVSHAQDIARGADIGWLSEMENSGKKFYNEKGAQQDLLQILKDHCINSIRLRVWLNPANGWCNKADVVAMAKRASAMGFRIMIDFHYSDTWADPGAQPKPAAWASYNNAQLPQAVYDHTFEVLNAIKQQGVTPEWCQIGNETNNGMLWDNGRASSDMAAYSQFVTSGNNAAHAVFPNIITIVHVANGNDNTLFTWNIGGLVKNGAKFDAVGMSLYPESTNWQTLTAQCLANMTSMANQYNKPVMICEIGMGWDSPTEAKAFVEDIIAKNQSLPNKKGLGVFWWEPETYNWKGYSKGAFDLNGRPTVALDGFATNCPKPPVRVRFVADFASAAVQTNAYITGTMTSDGTNWAIQPMKREAGSRFSADMQLSPGSIGAFYLLNANNWTARETVPAACATSYGTDRSYAIGNRDTTIYVTWNNCATTFDCHGVMNGTAAEDACGICSGGTTGKPVCAKQQIALAEGWNLISINVRPADSSINALFGMLHPLEIKNMDVFWRDDQPDFLNSLKTIIPSDGYLVKMNATGTLTITGTPISFSNLQITPSSNWYLTGCPYQTATPIAGLFASKFSAVKNFEGFWLPNNAQSSIGSVEPGKAYFFKIEK